MRYPRGENTEERQPSRGQKGEEELTKEERRRKENGKWGRHARETLPQGCGDARTQSAAEKTRERGAEFSKNWKERA